MNQEVYEKVQEIVADLLDIDPETITPESKFQADLGADSLDLVELIMEFEERFGSEISDEDAQKITTVGEAVKYVDERM
jgi:acyl carrier protein